MRELGLILGVVLAAVGTSSAEVMTFEAAADTSVSEGEPDASYGSAELVRISSHYDPACPEIGSGIRRGLVRFDVTGLPAGVAVLDVTFKAYQSNITWVGEGLVVYEAAESWAEDSITWNTQPAVGAALGPMTLGPDRYCSFATDALAQTVRSWVSDASTNWGLELRFHDEFDNSGQPGLRGDTLRSRESPADTPPLLIVEFDPDPPLVGDANRDGEVGVADLSALADHYGVLSGATWEMGDFNYDGQVGVADLAALADNYGKTKQAPVPAPASAAVLAAGAAALLRRRRTRT